ncbi:MAG: 30S ribosome-binding factor RbfA [Candidatus Saganbacteria bacterium]|nr:30S ribosome-binding factor RbfA [Candidatus Saganbacteria bacterium]
MNNRSKRLGELIKEEICRILREKVSDPRIGFASVTDVNLSPDLKTAKVFVSIYGTDLNKRESMQGLLSAKGYIQGELSRSLELRYTPSLNFVQDKSIERGGRVFAIMSKLEKEAAESKRISKKNKSK